MAPANSTMRGNDPSPSKFSSAQIQQSSNLMRLPLEIRLRIYWMLLGGRMLHLDIRPGGVKPLMGHCVCQPLSKEELTQQFNLYFDDKISKRPHSHFKCRPWDHTSEMQRLDLRALRTCQQIYHEAISTLWTTNTFSFHSCSAFHEFLWYKTLEQRRMIRYVRYGPSDVFSLEPWLEVAQIFLVQVAEENTIHLTIGVNEGDARNWPHTGACDLAFQILGANPDLFLCAADFNIEVEDDYGCISVITVEEIKELIRQRK